ncbi:MAG: glycosyltransferase family 2 protein [Desulfobacterales bacterium]
MDISIVVPIHNEAENIAGLVAEIHAALDGRHDYEIIYIDDHSTDRSPEVLKALQASFPRLRSLRHARRSGQSVGLLTGVKAASHPLIVTLDGDGQNDPADIEKVLAPFSEGAYEFPALMVIGHRTIRRDTRWRRLSSRAANSVRRWMLGDCVPDSGCGIKAFSRELFLSLPFFDHIHRFLPPLVKRAGGGVISVPVHHRPRRHGQSHYGTLDRLRVGIVDLLGVMWLMHRAGPRMAVRCAENASASPPIAGSSPVTTSRPHPT